MINLYLKKKLITVYLEMQKMKYLGKRICTLQWTQQHLASGFLIPILESEILKMN